MNDTDGPQGESLAEAAQQQNSNLQRVIDANSNLQRLIDAIGTLLAASRELLKRLQPIGEAAPAGAHTSQAPVGAEPEPSCCVDIEPPPSGSPPG